MFRHLRQHCQPQARQRDIPSRLRLLQSSHFAVCAATSANRTVRVWRARTLLDGGVVDWFVVEAGLFETELIGAMLLVVGPGLCIGELLAPALLPEAMSCRWGVCMGVNGTWDVSGAPDKIIRG